MSRCIILYILGFSAESVARNITTAESLEKNIAPSVWYEAHETMDSATQREKALKKWRRKWKIGLVESFNPDWTDLYEAIV